MHLWDLLPPQCDTTLNILRSSRVHPKISANDALNGTFNFTATPLVPVGCKVVVHEKLANRKTWDPAGTHGFYLGPAMQHYICYSCYVTKSKGIRNCDTVDFFPQQASISPETLQQSIEQKLQELVKLCKQYLNKLSKPADRSLGLLKDKIPALPLKPVHITAPTIPPPFFNKPIHHPIPTLHQYKTRSVTKQLHLIPKIHISFPRVHP